MRGVTVIVGVFDLKCRQRRLLRTKEPVHILDMSLGNANILIFSNHCLYLIWCEWSLTCTFARGGDVR